MWIDERQTKIFLQWDLTEKWNCLLKIRKKQLYKPLTITSFVTKAAFIENVDMKREQKGTKRSKPIHPHCKVYDTSLAFQNRLTKTLYGRLHKEKAKQAEKVVTDLHCKNCNCSFLRNLELEYHKKERIQRSDNVVEVTFKNKSRSLWMS